MRLGSRIKKYKFVEFGIIFVITFWIIETLVDIYVHQNFANFIESLFPSDLNELLLRLYVSLTILFFSVYVHFSFYKRRKLEDAYRKVQKERFDKLTLLGQLAGGIGHELRNPLGAIKNATYFLKMALEEPEPDIKETLDVLDKEINTSEMIISSLLGFARPKPPLFQKVNVNTIIQELLTRTTVPENIKINKDLNENLPGILGDPGQLSSAFRNIILNAIQAMGEGGQLTIKTNILKSGWISVSIIDTGLGISEENMKSLFEPLFTTKAKGIGLGLAIAKLMVENHGGIIRTESVVGEGCTFTIELPINNKGEN